MKKYISIISIIAAVILIGNIFAGCGPKKEGSKDVKELTFKVYHPIFSKSPLGTEAQKKWQEKMEKYMGLKLNITWQEVPFSDYSQKQQVYLAAGDFADVFLCMGTGQQSAVNNFQQLGEAGQLVNLMDYKDNINNYKKYLDNKWELAKVATKNGAVYGFADASQSSNTGNQYVHAIRFDTFKKDNINIPSDLNEYYQAVKTLKQKYPESYPITGFWGPETFIDTFLRINHTTYGLSYNGSKFVYAPFDEQDRFKEIIVYLNKLYKEGLIDPEFLTQNTDQTMQKMLTGKSFVVPAFMGIRINQYINNNKDYKVEWGIIPELKNMHGEIPWKIASNIKGKTLNPWAAIVISKKTKYPDLLVKLVDYQYSDEMFELANWGIEGVTFIKDSNGNREYTSTIMNAENPQIKLAEYGVNQSMSVRSGIQFMPQDKDSALKLLLPVPVYKDGNYGKENFWKFTSDVYGEASVSPLDNMPPVQFEPIERDNLSTIKTSLDTYVKENMIKFVTGAKSLDEWDSFIKGLITAGDYVKLVNNYNSKLSEIK